MSIVETAPPAPVGYAQEAMQQLREAIQHLPPEEKEVFLLRQNGELTYEQIAQLDNRPVEVVKEQMRSALRKLRHGCSGGFIGQSCPVVLKWQDQPDSHLLGDANQAQRTTATRRNRLPPGRRPDRQEWPGRTSCRATPLPVQPKKTAPTGPPASQWEPSHGLPSAQGRPLGSGWCVKCERSSPLPGV